MSGATLGGVTWAAVVRLQSGTSHNLISISTSAQGFTSSLDINGGLLNLGANNAGSSESTFTVTAAQGWQLLAASKAAGSAIPRMHRYLYGTGAWTHEDGDSFIDNGPAASGTSRIRLGSWADGTGVLTGDMAAGAMWRRVLTDADLERLAFSLLAWSQSAPTAMWVLDQADITTAVRDWTGGGADQAAIVGTTIATSGPPIGYGHPYIQATPIRAIHINATPPVLPGVASIPTPAVSTGVNAKPGVIAGTATVPTPDVFVGSSPPTLVQPAPVLATSTIPTPIIATGVTARPPLLVARAVIPTPAVDVPINPGDDLVAPGQLSFNGFVMGGPGNSYRWSKLGGAPFDMPGVDNGNVPHPSEHGSLSGSKYAQARRVSLEFFVRGPRDEVEQMSLDLQAGLPLPEADEELWLAVRVGEQILIGRGACLERRIEIAPHFRLGKAPGYALWELSNPRLYSRDLITAVIPDGASVDVAHAGNNTTHPLFRVPGPSLNPELVIERTLDDGSENVVTVGFNLTVAANETLILDPFYGTASVGDTDVGDSLSNSSLGIPDLVLGRGTSSITYSSELGTAPAMTALWRHAHI